MSSNNFPRVFLKNKEEKELQQGFPWVFDNEISHIKYRADNADDKSEWKNEVLGECSVEDGATVEVYTKAGGFLGTGIINKKSKITVRIIGSEHADVIMADTSAYYEKKVLDAYNMRRMFYKDGDSYRLIFGEADFIPGLICERFCDEKGNVIITEREENVAERDSEGNVVYRKETRQEKGVNDQTVLVANVFANWKKQEGIAW